MKLAIGVDLDGTLIHDDVTWLACRKFLRQNWWNIFFVILWLLRGRAYCKYRLAKEIEIDPRKLNYNKKLLEFLSEKKAEGHEIFLATGCSEIYAKKIIDRFDLFDGFFASNDSTNLIGDVKSKKLVEKFGEKNFIYIGNSSSDVAVWKKSAEAILVTPTSGALKKMRGKKYFLFS